MKDRPKQSRRGNGAGPSRGAARRPKPLGRAARWKLRRAYSAAMLRREVQKDVLPPGMAMCKSDQVEMARGTVNIKGVWESNSQGGAHPPCSIGNPWGPRRSQSVDQVAGLGEPRDQGPEPENGRDTVVRKTHVEAILGRSSPFRHED